LFTGPAAPEVIWRTVARSAHRVRDPVGPLVSLNPDTRVLAKVIATTPRH
jgi:hypothetical protein